MFPKFFYAFSLLSFLFLACGPATEQPQATEAEDPADPAPLSNQWVSLFGDQLEKADYPAGIWSQDEDGVLTATEDQHIWTKKDFDNFELQLDFKIADGTNSGVILYCSNVDNWIPNSVEVQIADDFAQKWIDAGINWQCGAIFGHQPAVEQQLVIVGDWNTYHITCQDQLISVKLNDRLINEFNMALFTEKETNPDGSEVPSWLSIPPAELPTHGKIGLQGKHAGAPIWFRNLKIREI